MKTNTPLTAGACYIITTYGNWGIFTWTDAGDLFVTCEYGNYWWAWRNFGEGDKNQNFANWLTTCKAQYIVEKFAFGYLSLCAKKLAHLRMQKLLTLVDEFLIYINKHHA